MVVELADCNIKWCHSRGCPDDLPHWRRVPGFPVFGVGQPSEAGFSKVSEKVSKDKCIWFNMRQEPVAYVGGQPVTPRKSVNPHDNIEIPGKVDDMDKLEVRQLESYRQKDFFFFNFRINLLRTWRAGNVARGMSTSSVTRRTPRTPWTERSSRSRSSWRTLRITKRFSPNSLLVPWTACQSSGKL